MLCSLFGLGYCARRNEEPLCGPSVRFAMSPAWGGKRILHLAPDMDLPQIILRARYRRNSEGLKAGPRATPPATAGGVPQAAEDASHYNPPTV